MDDLVIVSLLCIDNPYHGLVLKEVGDWCKAFYLDINVSKTKEMTVDCGNNPNVMPPVVIVDQAKEIVQQYKYLGTITDDKLTFEHNFDAVCNKTYQRLYFLGKNL